MITLFSLMMAMLVSGLGLVALPYWAQKSLFSFGFISCALFLVLFSLAIYSLSSNQAKLNQWITRGKQHYQLQVEINNLGGLTGIIQRIKQKLAANPNDAQGWFILGRIYLSNGNVDDAKKALENAYHLKPHDQEIKQFYDLSLRSR